MRIKLGSVLLIGLSLLAGWGCGSSVPVLDNTPAGRAYRLCQSLYPDDYIGSMIRTYQDANAAGLTASDARLAGHEGCDEGCAEAYYDHNGEVDCVWRCHPCVDAMVDLVYTPNPNAKELQGETLDIVSAVTDLHEIVARGIVDP